MKKRKLLLGLSLHVITLFTCLGVFALICIVGATEIFNFFAVTGKECLAHHCRWRLRLCYSIQWGNSRDQFRLGDTANQGDATK